jgi:hypothetical protein
MADETTICNLALAKLAIPPIMALTDDSTQAQFCSRFYAEARNEVLSSHRWNFAMKRGTLVKLVDAPAFEWAFAYQLPVDCLRVVQLNGYEQTQREAEFCIEGRTLLTNDEEANIRYIAEVVDGMLYPPLFVDALATKLASKLAGPLTGSRSMPSDLMADYEKITGPKARLADVFEAQHRLKPLWATSDLVASRFTRYPTNA